jgi:hypothetical protein
MKQRFKIIIACLTLILCITAISLPAIAAVPEELTPSEENKEAEALTESTEEAGILQSAYATVKEKSDRIFSLLAFIGTMVIAAIYRKGLIPGIRKASGIVSNAVNDIKGENEKLILESKEQAALICSLQKTVAELSDTVIGLAEGIDASKQINEQKKLFLMMDAQVDLLRDVFLSSSLPQYKKEAVEIRIKEMKENLNNEGADTEKV